MARTKKTTEPEASTPAAEPRPARTRAAAPKAAVAAHKHATKKATQPVEEAAGQPAREITRDDIARLAWSYWEARGYQGGSPEEDWFRAERELLKSA